MRTMDTITLLDSEYDALSYLVNHGPVFSVDIDYPMKWDFIFLKNHGLAKLELPDPNFLYHLPEDRHTAYQFKLTSYGYECYKREASAKQKLIDEQARHEAERISDRAHADQDRKLHFKHDWRIAVFNAISGFVLGAVSDHFLDIVGNAVRLWSSLLAMFH